MTTDPPYILGISAFYHDSAAALIRGAEIVAAAQEERFTRIKGDAAFPLHAVRYCLRQAGISASDLSSVAFYDKPLLKFERLLESHIVSAPFGLRSFLMAMPLWLKESSGWTTASSAAQASKARSSIPNTTTVTRRRHSFPAASRRPAIITMDGVGEWCTTSWGVGHDNQIELRRELRFPHSLGLLYRAFTYYTGFKVNSGDYKVMGLAPYGEPTYVRLILDI